MNNFFRFLPISFIKRKRSLKIEEMHFIFCKTLNPTLGLPLKYFQRNCLPQFIYIITMLSNAIITEAIKILFVAKKKNIIGNFFLTAAKIFSLLFKQKLNTEELFYLNVIIEPLSLFNFFHNLRKMP